MIPALVSADERAMTILCHEFGHIKNWDKFLPGVVLYSFINSAIYLITFGKVGIAIAIVLWATTSYVCRRREFAADAFAVGLLNSKTALVNTLQASEAYSGVTFFHPSLMQRCEAIDRRFPVTKVSLFWCTTWLLFALIGLFGYTFFAFSLLPRGGVIPLLDAYFYQQLTYLFPYFSIAGSALVLTAMVGLLVEFAKLFVRVK
jgi:hypothetical protein